MAKDYDPPMHTAEHVLNQTMVRLFGSGRCFSSHLNSGKSKCDYYFPRPLTDAEGTELEATINAVLERSLPVTEKRLPYSEAARLVDLTRLPADVSATALSDPDALVRLVLIGDYDICPCIGAHVDNTAAIGGFRLISHSFTPAEDGRGVLRLRFKLTPASMA